MSAAQKQAEGGCQCGGVRYRVTGGLRDVHACHCSQCRRLSGNFVAATRCKLEQMTMLGSATLKWYRSSDQAERGFCSACGGNLFWRDIGGDGISIMAGTLDAPTGLRTALHIFVGGKSDYYTLNDDAEKHASWPGAPHA